MQSLTTWLALAGSTWALFALAQDHLAEATQKHIVAWLRCEVALRQWPGMFGSVTASVFGQPLVSGACLLRVCLATHIAAFLTFCISGVLHPGLSSFVFVFLLLYAPLVLGGMALCTMLPGYLSLLSQRACLYRMQHATTRGRLVGWLLAEGVVQVALACGAWALSVLVVFVGIRSHLLRGPATWVVGYIEFILSGPTGSLHALREAVLLEPLLFPGVAFPSFGLWLYAPCFPTVWMWLYVVAGVCLRSLHALGVLPATSRGGGLLDVEARPLHTLGVVAIALLSVLYWGALYARS